MNRIGIGLLTVILCSDMTTGVIFAQAKPAPTEAPIIVVKSANPTPTPKTTQPTSNPAPTTAPTTTPVTQAPTLAVQPTTVPVVQKTQQEQEPTSTPTPIPPTPTSKPKAIVVTTVKKPPSNPVAQIISAPFNLVANSLPQSYYDDQGLAPTTNRALLAAAILCLASGTLLLSWPKLVQMKTRLSAPKLREESSIPYLGFKA